MGKLLSTESVTITVVVEARIPLSFKLMGVSNDEVRDTEIRDHRILKNIDQEYTGLLNNGNIDEVLAAAKRAIDAKKEQQPERRQEKALQKKNKGRT